VLLAVPALGRPGDGHPFFGCNGEMSLLPKSLYGRLVLVLLCGLLAAQAITLYINRTERDQLLYRAGGRGLAQRMVDIVQLLDTLPAAERPKVTALFRAPPLRVSLDEPPMADEAAAADADFRQTMFKTMLQRALGNAAKISISQVARPPLPPAFAPGMMGMGGPNRLGGLGPPPYAAAGPSILVQLPLGDGVLVTFDTTLSPQATDLPLRLALTLLVLLVSVALLSLLAVRWLTGPLSALAQAADQLGENINRAPMAETGPTEVRRAARAFNTMQQRLSRFISERSRILTAMSHDLKTPITRLRLRAELLEDETLRQKFGRDLDEMQAMVHETLEFMRDSSAAESVQAIDLMALIESMQADYRDSGRTVAIEGQIEGSLEARPLAVRRCLGNLVDNALRYGERATVVIDDQADNVVLRIRDAGPGIPESELEQVFEPFYRGEASRSRETGGSGLGLGIARNIAHAHGGDITLRNLPGGGLEANLRLPHSAT